MSDGIGINQQHNNSLLFENLVRNSTEANDDQYVYVKNNSLNTEGGFAHLFTFSSTNRTTLQALEQEIRASYGDRVGDKLETEFDEFRSGKLQMKLGDVRNLIATARSFYMNELSKQVVASYGPNVGDSFGNAAAEGLRSWANPVQLFLQEQILNKFGDTTAAKLVNIDVKTLNQNDIDTVMARATQIHEQLNIAKELPPETSSDDFINALPQPLQGELRELLNHNETINGASLRNLLGKYLDISAIERASSQVKAKIDNVNSKDSMVSVCKTLLKLGGRQDLDKFYAQVLSKFNDFDKTVRDMIGFAELRGNGTSPTGHKLERFNEIAALAEQYQSIYNEAKTKNLSATELNVYLKFLTDNLKANKQVNEQTRADLLAELPKLQLHLQKINEDSDYAFDAVTEGLAVDKQTLGMYKTAALSASQAFFLPLPLVNPNNPTVFSSENYDGLEDLKMMLTSGVAMSEFFKATTSDVQKQDLIQAFIYAGSLSINIIFENLDKMREIQPKGNLTPQTVWKACFNEEMPEDILDCPRFTKAFRNREQALYADMFIKEMQQEDKNTAIAQIDSETKSLYRYKLVEMGILPNTPEAEKLWASCRTEALVKFSETTMITYQKEDGTPQMSPLSVRIGTLMGLLGTSCFVKLGTIIETMLKPRDITSEDLKILPKAHLLAPEHTIELGYEQLIKDFKRQGNQNTSVTIDLGDNNPVVVRNDDQGFTSPEDLAKFNDYQDSSKHSKILNSARNLCTNANGVLNEKQLITMLYSMTQAGPVSVLRGLPLVFGKEAKQGEHSGMEYQFRKLDNDDIELIAKSPANDEVNLNVRIVIKPDGSSKCEDFSLKSGYGFIPSTVKLSQE